MDTAMMIPEGIAGWAAREHVVSAAAIGSWPAVCMKGRREATWVASRTLVKWERYFMRQRKKMCHGDVMVLSWFRVSDSTQNR